MTEYFLDKGAKNFVIMSGGASSGNRLHQVRTWGMLNTLEEKAGLVLTEEAETLSTTEEVTKAFQMKMVLYRLRSVRDTQSRTDRDLKI